MLFPNGQFRFLFTPRDYDAARAFYRNGLQLPIDHEWDYGGGDKGIVFLAGGGMVELLGLFPGQEYVKPQGVGMVVQVENADRAHELALQRGLPVLEGPVTQPWGHRTVRLQDPDGVVVTLFEVVGG